MASTPLPALLRPDAAAGRHVAVAGPANDVQRGMLIGAGVGCVVMGAFLGLTLDADAEGAGLQNTLLGCGFGAFVGTVFGFVFSAGPSISKR